MAKRKKKGQVKVEEKAKRLVKLQIQNVPLKSLRPNAYNPNRQSDHDFELLCRSILEDGYTQPIVVQEESDEIIDGEHRWTAMIVVEALRRDGKLKDFTISDLKDLREERFTLLESVGQETIAVVKTNMTPEQMRIATLRHNRARGSEDVDLATDVLRDLRELGALDWAQESLMMDDVELQRLLDDATAAEELAADEFSPAWEPGVEETISSVTTDSSKEVSETPAAVQSRAERRERLENARTEADKAIIKQETKTFRLVCVFAGEEADVVQAILGDTPASKVLELCRQALG